MKLTLFAVLGFTLIAKFTNAGETLTLVAEEAVPGGEPNFSAGISLSEGDVLTVLYQGRPEYTSFEVKIGEKVIDLYFVGGQRSLPVIVGPAVIRLRNGEPSRKSLATVRIDRSGHTEANPAGAVIAIPADNKAKFVATLEASKDLKAWRPVDPGVVEDEDESRFFRARLTPTNAN